MQSTPRLHSCSYMIGINKTETTGHKNMVYIVFFFYFPLNFEEQLPNPSLHYGSVKEQR